MTFAASCLLICGFSCIAFLIGWSMAYRLGKHAGWCERHFEWIADEQAKRAADGRFCRRGGE